MTIARNLSILAENVNATGQVSLTAGVTSTLPIANGGTGLTSTPSNGQLDIGNGTGFTRASITAGTGISVTNGAGSITIATSGSSGVTSVATGNGLSGGTITSTGTLVVACPSFNSVGSYAAVVGSFSGGPSGGSNYSAGAGTDQLRACANFLSGSSSNSLSGTWKWMGGNTDGGDRAAIACRVS